ncbi:MAG: hypothetical protein L6Q37_07615 [Bdellovibrionaceae bacterium]|nr:hypothetical protein [Pseudobdellovibrionaceae bacterium]
MKTTRFTQLINVLLFCFMATTNVLADGEPRNGPRLSGASIPLKFDRAITEKQLLDITTECYNKFVIYPFLQKISLNSNEALTLNDENTPESKYYWFSSSFRIEQEESERTILLETHNSQKPLMSFDLKPLLINLDGYKHELSSLDYATFSDSRSVEENVIIIRAKPIDYIGKLTERKLYFKLPAVKYDIQISEVIDDYKELSKVPSIKNLRIEGVSSEVHPLLNYTNQKAVNFTINTKEYVRCIKSEIAGKK